MSLTIREYVKFVAPHLFPRFPTVWNRREIQCPIWPADVFAICCSILHHSGAIRSVGTRFLPESTTLREARIQETKDLADQWRVCAGKNVPCPEITKLWEQAIVDGAPRVIAELGCIGAETGDGCADTCSAIVRLCTIADEAFAGVGISTQRSFPLDAPGDPPDENQAAEEDFWSESEHLLLNLQAQDSGTFSLGATLCRDIDPSRLRVLPKAQPPTNGLSTRSISTYLSLCPHVDVPVNWFRYFNVATDRKCNLLLVPWPFEVRPKQFVNSKVDPMNDRVGWFGFKPDEDWHAPVNKVKELLEKARRDVGVVDAVVLPETAVTPRQHVELQAYLSDQKIPLIAGVCEPGDSDSNDELRKLGRNYAALSFPTADSWKPDTSFVQDKHHRWKLDGSQIESYGLATQLDPQKSWWEGIELKNRSLNFFALSDWLCSCVLICEDLARLDPAGQFVRAVAPDLVIALLFDGPQLPTRWPAYHATVLADDPGSSVLTLSCLGMTRLSRPRSVADTSATRGVVGMWKDPRKGHVSIKIPEDKEAALLTLTRYNSFCETADGRSNTQVAGAPEFAGIYYL